MQETVAGCILQRWQPGMNDPFFLSWVMVGIYLLAAILAFAVVLRATLPAATRGRERLFWGLVAVVLTFMAVNKQADLQTLLLAAGSCLTKAVGWTGQNQRIEGVAMVLLAGAAFAAGALILWGLRPTLRRTALPLLGLTLMASFVVFRAAEIFDFLGPLRQVARGHWPDRILEVSGPAVIIAGALILLSRRARKAPAGRLS